MTDSQRNPDTKIGEQRQIINGWEYVKNQTSNRWEVVSGPHSGHVTVSDTAPERDDDIYPLEEGELWWQPRESVMYVYSPKTIGSGYEWKPIVSERRGRPGEEGPAGADGKDGQDAPNPYVGPNNNWWCYSYQESDGSIPNRYVPYDTGVPCTGMNKLLNIVGAVNDPSELPR